MIVRTWYLGILLFFSTVAAFSAQLNRVSVSSQNDRTTLYLTINGPFTHKLMTLPNPNRIVVDLNDTHLGVNLNQLGLTNRLIKRVRSGQSNARTLRLVFEVNQSVSVQSAPWNAKGVRIDLLYRNTPVQHRPTTPSVSNIKPKLSKAPPISQQKVVHAVKQPQSVLIHNKPIAISHRPSNQMRSVVIVLDAGHGGKDPGARGPRHSREKDVVLAITLKLKKLIDRQPGMRAVLTRSGDYYIGLRQRLDMARKYNGDIFVSIHADAFNNPHSNGASVFALSPRGATSEAARWLAEKENYSELGGVNLGDLDDQNGVVRSVLIDLSQTATINAGLQMGQRVLSQLNSFTTLHNNKVEQARFVVLKSPDIPSILVETGFISNPREEKNLTSAAYQERLSQSIFQGIKGYFWENPPHGSRIEAMISTKIHWVKAGETLPSIAARYHISIATLQAANRFYGRNLKPGQKLVIPSAWA